MSWFLVLRIWWRRPRLVLRRLLRRPIGLSRAGSIVCGLRWWRTVGRWSVVGWLRPGRDNNRSRSDRNREWYWDRSGSLGLIVGLRRSLWCSIIIERSGLWSSIAVSSWGLRSAEAVSAWSTIGVPGRGLNRSRSMGMFVFVVVRMTATVSFLGKYRL